MYDAKGSPKGLLTALLSGAHARGCASAAALLRWKDGATAKAVTDSFSFFSELDEEEEEEEEEEAP